MNSKPTPEGKRVIRVCVVDDHPVVREGLRKLLGRESDISVCGEAANCTDGLEVIRAQRPDLVIVDISLDGRSGIDLIKEVRSQGWKMPVVVLSVHTEPTYAERALRAGAQGYVLKENAPDLITKAIRYVMAGEIFVCERMSLRLLSRMLGAEPGSLARSPLSNLTDRELEVLELIAKGERTGRVAERMSLSVSTVEAHRAKIKRKLGLRTAGELLRFALEWERSTPGRSAAAENP